jgi:hypothetical protein
VDFIAIDKEVTFPNGSNQARQCVNITILNDSVEEGDNVEIFQVQLLPAVQGIPAGMINFDLLKINIMDSDGE